MTCAEQMVFRKPGNIEGVCIAWRVKSTSEPKKALQPQVRMPVESATVIVHSCRIYSTRVTFSHWDVHRTMHTGVYRRVKPLVGQYSNRPGTRDLKSMV
jgi:hypothetical protein